MSAQSHGWSRWPSNRKAELPADWQVRRLRVLRRDSYRCQALVGAGVLCGSPANQVDHIERGTDHELSNLQALCRSCHARKTTAEAHAEQRRRRHVEPEPHPGVVG